MATLDELMATRLKARKPEVKVDQARKWARNYIDAVVRHLTLQVMQHKNEFFFEDGSPRAFTYCKKSVGDKSKQTSLEGRPYASTVFEAYKDTALLEVVVVGSNINGKLTVGNINPQLSELLQDELNMYMHEQTMTEIPVDFFTKRKEAPNDKNLFPVKTRVDRKALSDYVAYTKNGLSKADKNRTIYDTDSNEIKSQKRRGNALYEKLSRNLTMGNLILSYLEQDADGFYSQEYWKEIDSGRLYGTGLNLQSVDKTLRESALGKGIHKYDFSACCYTLLNNLACAIICEKLDAIGPVLTDAEREGIYAQTFPALRGYATNRKSIRKQIANDVGISEEQAKQAMTMIGFGAKLQQAPVKNGKGDNAFSDNFYPDQIKALRANDGIMKIYKEFTEATDHIDEYIVDGIEFCGRVYHATVDGVKRNRGQKIAWAYQVMEREALDLVVSHAEKYGVEVVLKVHDCIYTKGRLPEFAYLNIYKLKESGFPHLALDHEESTPYGTNYTAGVRMNAAMESTASFIEEQEELARKYTASFCETSGDSKSEQFEMVSVGGMMIEVPVGSFGEPKKVETERQRCIREYGYDMCSGQ